MLINVITNFTYHSSLKNSLMKEKEKYNCKRDNHLESLKGCIFQF